MRNYSKRPQSPVDGLDNMKFTSERTASNKSWSLPVFRGGDTIVVRLPVRFYRRNGHQMVLTRGDNGQASPNRKTNGSLVSALYRWQK